MCVFYSYPAKVIEISTEKIVLSILGIGRVRYSPRLFELSDFKFEVGDWLHLTMYPESVDIFKINRPTEEDNLEEWIK